MTAAAPNSSITGLLRIASLSTAVGFGSVTASLYSLRQGESGMTFVLTFGTAIAFGVGAILGWLYWRVLTRLITDPAGPKVGRLVAFNLIVGVIGIMAFLYPMRFIRPERLREVMEGMGAAFLVLAFVGFVLWRVIKFLNEDSVRNG